MAEALTIDFSQPFPLFPLETTILLPHATVPLHIFEPRYRAMTRAALEGSHLIAMATLEGDDAPELDEGSPPIREHLCLGYIVRHQRMPDGRYTLLLQGICRARLLQELPHEPYRLGLLEPTEVQPAMEIDLESERQEIEGLLADEVLGELAAVKAIRQWLSREIPTAALIDLSTLALASQASERYAMLAEDDAHRRAQWLAHHLHGIRTTLRTVARFGPGKSDEGWPLN